MKTRIIVIFGGVYSSLGKGIIASSIARILIECKHTIANMKLEPYINVNPGLMSPFQHGEVYVTYDNGETDLDLGNYERFSGKKISYDALVTTGQIYHHVINKERNGEYEGKTVQVIPHITNEIKQRIYDYIKKNNNPDFLIIEVGGTVGDIESLSMVEALCEFKQEIGENNFLPILCAPIIYLGDTTGEFKTKPCQHAVRELSHLGIWPRMLILRADCDIDISSIQKLGAMCHIESKNIFLSKTLKNIYLVPNSLFEQKIVDAIYRYFKIKVPICSKLAYWEKFTNKILICKKNITIGLVGKYTSLHDAYQSVIEAIKLAGWENLCNVKIRFIESDTLTTDQIVAKELKDIDGLIVPGGFGSRGVEGMINAIKYVRVNKIPYLGICYGMQLATIEFARNVLKMKNANTTENDPNTKFPIFDYIDGRMRLGEQEMILSKNTLAYKLYQNTNVKQRHRHRWEFNNIYKEQFAKYGYIISAVSNDQEKTAEIIELKNHPYFIGCQFHPEFSSWPNKNDPAFLGLIKAAMKK